MACQVQAVGQQFDLTVMSMVRQVDARLGLRPTVAAESQLGALEFAGVGCGMGTALVVCCKRPGT